MKSVCQSWLGALGIDIAKNVFQFWGQRYPAIAQSWQRNWEHVVPFFAYPESVRRIIYTTNAIEALNAKLRRAVRARGHFPNDDAAMKLQVLRAA